MKLPLATRKRQGGFVLNPFRFGAAGGGGGGSGGFATSAKMKQITIAGAAGAGTGYQVLLKVGESVGAAGFDFSIGATATFPSVSASGVSSLGDLQFLTADLSTLVPAWVEQVTGAAPNRVAWIWVKIAADLGTDQSIYCVYNNGAPVQTSNGRAVFQLFDDFLGGTLDTNQWSYTNGTTSTVSNGELSVTGAAAYISISSAATFGDNAELVGRAQLPSTTAGYVGDFGFGGCLYLRNDWDTQSTSEVVLATAGAPVLTELSIRTQNVYARLRVRRSAGAGSVLIDDTSYYSVNTGVLTGVYSLTITKVYDSGTTGKVDWVGLKKYQLVEPALSSVGSESAYYTNNAQSVVTYPTWDLNNAGSGATINSSLLTCTGISTTGWAHANMGMSSGVYYWECTSNGGRYPIIGVGLASSNTGYPGIDANSYSYYGLTAVKINNNVQTAYGSVWNATTSVVGVKFDATNGTLEFFMNGVSMGVAFTGIPAGTYYPMTGGDTTSGTSNCTVNFGELPFAYTIPTGASKLCRHDPTISAPTAFGGLALWLDASDAASLVVNGSNQITSWTDKSGTGVAFTQATSGNMPTLNATLFPKNCVNFGFGANSWLTAATNIVVPVNSTVFIVFYWANRGSSYASINLQKGTSSSALQSNNGVPYWSMYTATGMSGFPSATTEFTDTGAIYTYIATGVAPVNTKGMTAVRVPSSMSKSVLRMNRASRKTGGGTTDAMSAPALINTIGSTDTTYTINGAIAEVVIYNTALSDVQMRQVEEYLTAKWATP